MFMRKPIQYGVVAICLIVFIFSVQAQQQDVITASPLANQIRVSASPVTSSGTFTLPLITWGGDVATIYTENVFSQAGLQFELKTENNFRKQVEDCISGQTPYLRGTMGMIVSAVEAFKQKGLEIAPIFQLTWSVGGDAMVVRGGIKTPADLRGKTIALQLYGPHMDYVANILSNAKVPLSSVKFRYFKELTFPTYDTSSIVDPVSAFQMDSSIDAVMCIIPDALMLTSGGKVGTGAEGSVQGAKIMLSTKTASRIICDVYAVRKDYLDSHKSQVQKFVHTLMVGQEQLQDLIKNKSIQQAKFNQLMSKSADLLLGAPQATEDVKALLGDCEYVGYDGNVKFFTGAGTTRNLKNLTAEITKSFKSMGLLTSSVTLNSPNWDYNALSKGLRYATVTPAAATAKVVSPGAKPKPTPRKKSKPKFDAARVTKKVETAISVEPETWESEGTLFVVEIFFAPNQKKFSVEQYADDFQEALRIADTYGGALIVIEGHADPLGVAKAKKDGKHPAEIAQMEQNAKNLSKQRAETVRDSFLKYCKEKGVEIDASQFVPVGLGIAAPLYPKPRTKTEWAANRRVVFRIKQVETELEEFIPLD
ncbi:TPA: nitrate ABC transporter substrate-binding protein [Candidatus Poribacteria bacterium]|nr:nitrate ABC transporter substrate-binding protein [Candidatus Poribacteria bacterium]